MIAKPGTPVRQFTVMLENRVGALGCLLRLLQPEGVDVLGISVQDSSDVTLARMIFSDPDTVQRVFFENGVPHVMGEVLIIALRESGPQLLECLDVLFGAETNVHYAYSLLPEPGGHSMLAILPEDSEYARGILLRSGFRIVYQEDLSR